MSTMDMNSMHGMHGTGCASWTCTACMAVNDCVIDMHTRGTECVSYVHARHWLLGIQGVQGVQGGGYRGLQGMRTVRGGDVGDAGGIESAGDLAGGGHVGDAWGTLGRWRVHWMQGIHRVCRSCRTGREQSHLVAACSQGVSASCTADHLGQRHAFKWADKSMHLGVGGI